MLVKLTISLMVVMSLLSSFHQNMAVLTQAVFVGDSLTWGYGSTDFVGFVGMASQDLGWQDTRFVTCHLGDSIAQWWKVEDIHPDVVVIELGVHAVVGCDHIAKPYDQFREYYGQLLDLAVKTAENVYVLNVPSLWPHQTLVAWQYNEIITEEATARGIPVIDAWGATVNCLECFDGGLHPNDVGYRRLADALVDVAKNSTVQYRIHFPMLTKVE